MKKLLIALFICISCIQNSCANESSEKELTKKQLKRLKDEFDSYDATSDRDAFENAVHSMKSCCGFLSKEDRDNCYTAVKELEAAINAADDGFLEEPFNIKTQQALKAALLVLPDQEEVFKLKFSKR